MSKKLLQDHRNVGLDMVLWEGHVFYILDSTKTIESRAAKGFVYLTDIKERFERIFIEDKKISQNISGNKQGYVIRRWIEFYPSFVTKRV